MQDWVGSKNFRNDARLSFIPICISEEFQFVFYKMTLGHGDYDILWINNYDRIFVFNKQCHAQFGNGLREENRFFLLKLWRSTGWKHVLRLKGKIFHWTINWSGLGSNDRQVFFFRVDFYAFDLRWAALLSFWRAQKVLIRLKVRLGQKEQRHHLGLGHGLRSCQIWRHMRKTPRNMLGLVASVRYWRNWRYSSTPPARCVIGIECLLCIVIW